MKYTWLESTEWVLTKKWMVSSYITCVCVWLTESVGHGTNASGPGAAFLNGDCVLGAERQKWVRTLQTEQMMRQAELQEMTDTVNITKHTDESVVSDSRNTLTMLMPKSSSTASSMSVCLCARLAVPPSSSRLICEICRSCDDEQMREEERCVCTCSEWTDEWREKLFF